MSVSYSSDVVADVTDVKQGLCPNLKLFYASCNKYQNCRNDNDCDGAQKCCEYSNCGSKCLDAILETIPKQCIYNGEVHESGETFQPDLCTRCKCQPGTQGDERYGGAVCQLIDCPAQDCTSRDLQIPYGSCCPVCGNVSGMALDITNCPPGDISLDVNANKDFVVFHWEPEVIDNLNLRREIKIVKDPKGHIYEWVGKNVPQVVKAHALAVAPDGGMHSSDNCVFNIYVRGNHSLVSFKAESGLPLEAYV